MEKMTVDQIFPKASEEDMVIAIGVLIKDANEDAKKIAEEDPIHKKIKEIYSQLFMDAFDHGLDVELCEARLEHPEWNIVELDYHFRREYDLY